MNYIYTDTAASHDLGLRDYQEDLINKLRDRLLAGKKRPVVQAPTGAGKTVIAAAIVRMALEKGKRVLFTVPSLTLIDQTVERFQQNSINAIGVVQAAHEMTDYSQPVQVCSVQTLARRIIPKADMVIVDEAHVMFKLYPRWMSMPEWKHVPFIGLTATPWARGMGKIWDDLIVAVTTQNLIDKGHLSDFRVFAPAHPDLTEVKTVAGDYELKGLGNAMDKAELVADIVTVWLEKGENRQTVCFAVNRIHAKNIQQKFISAGISAEYMDAYTDIGERGDIFRRFANGDVKVICNVGVLTTGFDADVRCIILARPTKSEILYAQMIGRGLRTADGKDHCLILDHSDTTIRLGFVTDLHHPNLDDGEKRKHFKQDDKKPLPKECPKCSFLKPPKMLICQACGFKPEPINKIEVIDGDLYEINRQKMMKLTEVPVSVRQKFYSEVLLHAYLRGYKDGWAAYAYKDKFKDWPDSSLEKKRSNEISWTTQNWITHYNIKKARSKTNKPYNFKSFRLGL